MSTAAAWRSIVLVIFCLLLQVAVGAAADLSLGDPRTMRFPTVEFNPPDAERIVLDNGMVVYLLEDHELPLVTVNATIRTGSWLDPADKVGLAGMTGAAMRTGGSAKLSPDEVDEELEQLAATISIGFAKESGSASLDVLKKDVKRRLEIFA
ncbi:insulinase family protein, partial [Nitrospirales bacterium NOB]|nr:insulinase family protein [Nitrospirales bacterium NOB]